MDNLFAVVHTPCKSSPAALRTKNDQANPRFFLGFLCDHSDYPAQSFPQSLLALLWIRCSLTAAALINKGLR
ncbi:hypothetical protein DENIT_12439 [Pseudomonas veronii]|nr:hypothetical protein DENIT_12439 [Pseudomonas veronii]